MHFVWTCQGCGTENETDTVICRACGRDYLGLEKQAPEERITLLERMLHGHTHTIRGKIKLPANKAR